jgi:hypothetical protein
MSITEHVGPHIPHPDFFAISALSLLFLCQWISAKEENSSVHFCTFFSRAFFLRNIHRFSGETFDAQSLSLLSRESRIPDGAMKSRPFGP